MKFKLRIFISLSVLAGVIYFLLSKFAEVSELVALIQTTSYRWIFVAVILQIITYVCDGGIWYNTTKSSGYHIQLRTLARLSVEQLSINQFIPSGGVAGNALVARTLLRLEIPERIVAKVISVDILALVTSYSIMSFAALFTLNLYGLAHSLAVGVLVGFFGVSMVATVGLWYFLEHGSRRMPAWVLRIKIARKVIDLVNQTPQEEIVPVRLLIKVIALKTSIFIIDSLTLWSILYSLHISVGLSVAFTAFVIASIGGILSFMPGGVGGFEAAGIGILVLFKVPLEAAVAATLILRGLILWLPLIPGLVFARREIFPSGVS